MLQPHFMNDDLPYIYLPFVRDTVDLSQAILVVKAEIGVALAGWNNTDWGNTYDFWMYLISRYGHYRIMQQFTEEQNGSLICDNVDFNTFAKPVFDSNYEKYNRLANALKTTYDVLKPYNIQEEHSTGDKHSKATTHYDTHEDKNKESSMDNTTLYDASSTYFDTHDDYVEREHNQSTTFAGNSFEPNSDDTSHSMDSRVGNIGNHSYAELIEKEIKLARYNFWDIIAKDILDNGCLKIFYTSC